MQHHTRWRTANRVMEADRACHEPELLCALLELAGCYDQFDLGCLASMEVLVRRLIGSRRSNRAGAWRPADSRRDMKLIVYPRVAGGVTSTMPVMMPAESKWRDLLP